MDKSLFLEAADPTTSAKRLDKLYLNEHLRRTIASNPNISASLIDKLAKDFPIEMLSNPALAMLEVSGYLLPSLSLVSRLSLLLASPQESDLFARFHIRESLIKALTSCSGEVLLQRVESWSSRLVFSIDAGSIDGKPANPIKGYFDLSSEEYGEVRTGLCLISSTTQELRDLPKGIAEILECEEYISCQELEDSLELHLGSVLTALSSGDPRSLEQADMIRGEYESIFDEICLEHTSNKSVICSIAPDANSQLADDFDGNHAIVIDGHNVELELDDGKVVARWCDSVGRHSLALSTEWEPSGIDDGPKFSIGIQDLGELALLWGWAPPILHPTVPKDWIRFIVHGIISSERSVLADSP